MWFVGIIWPPDSTGQIEKSYRLTGGGEEKARRLGKGLRVTSWYSRERSLDLGLEAAHCEG